MKIGAPINDPLTGGFLRKLIEHAASSVDQEPPIIDLPPFFGGDNEELEPISGGYRLLVINRDEIPNKGFNRTPESSAAAKPGEFGGGAG